MYAVPSENDLISLKQTIDDQFLILYGVLVLLLQVGFACIEISRVRDKYASRIFFKIFLHTVVSCCLYWLIGFCLSYGEGNSFTGFVAFPNWNLSTTVTAAVFDSIPAANRSSSSSNHCEWWLYDALVMATPVTILSAVILERCNAVTFLIYSVIISGVVHPISVHWAWTAQGWLRCLGYVDFSGTGVVFAFAGASSFIASLMMGPRKGRFNENSEISPIYSTSLLGTGGTLAIIGFIAFNCGAFYRTNGAADDNTTSNGDRDVGNSVSVIATASLNKLVQNEIISGAGGCFVALLIGRFRIRQSLWLLSNTINGCLTAMVAVSAAVITYSTLEAFIIGVISALIFTALRYFILLLKIDDPIDACPIYFGGGVWGILAMKIFSSNGMLQSKNLTEDAWVLMINFAGVIAICLWSTVWTVLATLLVKTVEKLTEKVETEVALDATNLYPDDSCYIEALPYPFPYPNTNTNTNANTNDNDKMKSDTAVADEYISKLKNRTWKILNKDCRLYENLDVDMELQVRR